MDERLFGEVASAPRARKLWPILAIALTLLASVVLVLIPASTGRNGGLAAAYLPQPTAESRYGKIPGTLRPTRLQQFSAEENIDALATVVGRKYRVSHDITRGFVGAAYLEAERNRLDPMLIVAVMAVESGFNPAAQSEGGAIGLMQVIPRYHPDKFSAARGESVRDPSTNIRVGSRALKEYIVRAGTEAAGLQLYNGASGDASNAYAAKVTAERKRLQDAMRRARERV